MGAVTKTFNDRQYKKIEKLAADGVPRAHIAKAMRISPATFYRWLKTDERLKLAITDGRDMDLALCKSVMRDRAIDSRNPAWMDRYLFHVHGLNNINSPSGSGGGINIIVNIPFPTGSNEPQQALIIDQDPALNDASMIPSNGEAHG